ncbi:MAG: hypothetical protein AAF360_01550 [Pseudomonadota bacterium]
MATEYIDPNRAKARETFHGKTLTDSQFEEAYAISTILEREIQKSGSFRDKLTDYAHAFARDQRFDALKGEEILRDVFKGRYGHSMNEQREALLEREAAIKDSAPDQALHHAKAVLKTIETDIQPFYRAFDDQAVAMARKHGLTETGAKRMMSEAHEQSEGRSLYEAGKEVEAAYYTPAKEVERAEHKQSALQKRSSPSRIMS